MKVEKLAVLAAITGALIVGIDYLVGGYGQHPQAALMFTLVIWMAIFQGSVALVAAVDLAQGKWILPVRRQLLAAYPLILFCGVLFLFLIPQWGLYPFAHTPAEHGWFNHNFHVIRNFVMIVITFGLAWKYSRETLAGSEVRGYYAVLYIMAFVICQTLVACDWVMPLNYPWNTTLFGAYFFVEAMSMALCCSAIYNFFLHGRAIKTKGEVSPALKKCLYDTGVVMCGFGLLWAYLTYAHYLTIWYGNLPEEQDIFTRRFFLAPYKQMAVINLVMMFVIPFVSLLFKRNKQSRYFMVGIAGVVLSGQIVEKLFIFAPFTTAIMEKPIAPISFPALILEFALMGFLFITLQRETFANLPAEEDKGAAHH